MRRYRIVQRHVDWFEPQVWAILFPFWRPFVYFQIDHYSGVDELILTKEKALEYCEQHKKMDFFGHIYTGPQLPDLPYKPTPAEFSAHVQAAEEMARQAVERDYRRHEPFHTIYHEVP